MNKNNHNIFESLENRTLFAAPLVITHGGTYTGTWESLDSRTPAVTIKTTEPVIIENSTISGHGNLIVSSVDHANITVKNTVGTGLNPNVVGVVPGRFLNAENFDNIVLDGNTLNNTSGISLLQYSGDFTSNETIRIVNNNAHNIDGRKSDGNGGFMDFNTRTNKSTGRTEDGFELVQFVQFDKVYNVPGIEIAWNKVVNDPGLSRVEDNISIYKSSGTASSPIKIHDNYIQGAYTIKPWQSDTSDSTYDYDWSFSGGGIMLSDGVGSSAGGDPGFVKAYNNTVISTTNYGIAVSSGHDMEVYNNRVISSGKTSDGRAITAQNVGIYIWDSHKVGSTRFYNNVGHDNVVGWMLGSTHNDWWVPNATSFTNNIRLSGTITNATEAAELASWVGRRLTGAGTGTGTGTGTDTETGTGTDTGTDTGTGGEEEPTGIIAGTVFNDRNCDGARGERDDGATGFDVHLDLDGDGVVDNDEPVSRSSSTGRYRFEKLQDGVYTVRLRTREGWRMTKGSTATLTIDGGEMTTRYFGVTNQTAVAGMVYMDANRDGGLDEGEDGLEGWRVYDDANLNGLFDEGESNAITNASGKYILIGLEPGRHEIRVEQRSGYRRTSPGAGYRGVDLAAGELVESRNFGQKRISRAA